MASVYILFPLHACECGNCLSIDHLFLHFSSKRPVFLFCNFPRRMYWWPPVVSYYITFHVLSNSTHPFVASWRMVIRLQDAWIWQGSYYCHYFFPLQHWHYVPPYVQGTQLYRAMSLYATWVGSAYYLQNHALKNTLEPKTKRISHCVAI
jgi:hypothetical protein